MFSHVMIKIHVIFKPVFLLVVLAGFAAASTAWADVIGNVSDSFSIEHHMPASSDQSENTLKHFEDEREQERDGGEEGFIIGQYESQSFIVRQPTAMLLARLIQSFSVSVFKIPII